MTLRGVWTPAEQKALKAAFTAPAAVDALEKAFSRLSSPVEVPPKSASERGETFSLPLLAHVQGDLLVDAGESAALEGLLSMADVDALLDDTEFPREVETLQRARLGIGQAGKLKLDPVERLEVQMGLFNVRESADPTDLLWWLERQLAAPDIDPEEMAAWLSTSLEHLMGPRDLQIQELAYRKARLRDALARRIKAARQKGNTQRFLALMGDEPALSADSRLQCTFSDGRYAWDWQYNGFVTLEKHFFPQIGNLKSQGEEFDCAHFIASELEGVKDWIRNVERKPSSFSLPTSRHRFYPDFLVRMESGHVIVVEYKGADRYDQPEQVEKRRIGELWARRAGDRYHFVMPKQRDWASIRAALKD